MAVLGTGLPEVVAKEQKALPEASWQKVELSQCGFSGLSKYHPFQAFCFQNATTPGYSELRLVNLKNSQAPSTPVYTDNISFSFEDPDSGAIYVIFSGGTFGRFDSTYNRDNYRSVAKGPTDYITDSIIRTAGTGTGVLFLRWSNFSYWFSSYDNGLSWQPRFEQDDPHDHAVIYDLQFTKANPQVAYGLSRTVTEKQADGQVLNYSYLYKTTDMGRNFSRVYRTPDYYSTGDETVTYSLLLPSSPARSEGLVYLKRSGKGPSVYFRSTDGGNSFQEIGSTGFDYIAPDGALLLTDQVACDSKTKCRITSPARRSIDNGTSYQPLMAVPGYYIERFFLPSQNSSVYYALARPLDRSKAEIAHSQLLRSTDGGTSWTVLPQKGGPDLDGEYYYNVYITVSDYSPLTLAVENSSGYHSSSVYLWQDEVAEQLQTRGVTPKPGQGYYEATGHNLSNFFKDYWNSKGGLAQFGYPRTEAFREVNQSDGHIYYTQYFERNRFEYHPENKGTSYEVLLGLLGNQLTTERRNAGEGAFNRFEDLHYSGGNYYPQTGHNLRNSFKAYWEGHGGLELYGYPISEEFYEVNPDDGHSYVVQYFERARFEFHPENKGTTYEVLLGLMGNSLLRQKGWL